LSTAFIDPNTRLGGARSVLGVLAQRRQGASSPSLTLRRLKRGVFRSVDDLKATINRFIADTNADPKSLVWTADPAVLAAVKRGKQALESVH
jgi:hypothetical protein